MTFKGILFSFISSNSQISTS